MAACRARVRRGFRAIDIREIRQGHLDNVRQRRVDRLCAGSNLYCDPFSSGTSCGPAGRGTRRGYCLKHFTGRAVVGLLHRRRTECRDIGQRQEDQSGCRAVMLFPISGARRSTLTVPIGATLNARACVSMSMAPMKSCAFLTVSPTGRSLTNRRAAKDGWPRFGIRCQEAFTQSRPEWGPAHQADHECRRFRHADSKPTEGGCRSWLKDNI